MRRLLTGATLLGAASLVAAPAFSAATPNPCVLITFVDASAVLGATPKSVPKTLGLFKSCTYTVKKKTLTVQTRHVARKSDFEKSAKANPGGVFPIHGVGADAFSAGGGTVLLVWANGVEVTFTFGGFNPVVASQQSLAKTAISRL